MKRTLLIAATAIALSAPAVPHAHAAEIAVGTPGQFLDTRHHVVVMNGSEADARLAYAKIVCRARFGIEAGAPVIPPGYGACLKSQGFVWISDSPAQIAARERAVQGQRTAAFMRDLGQAFTDAATADMNRPRQQSCSGTILRGGTVDMTCR